MKQNRIANSFKKNIIFCNKQDLRLYRKRLDQKLNSHELYIQKFHIQVCDTDTALEPWWYYETNRQLKFYIQNNYTC